MNHDTYPDSYIRGILTSVKTIAVVGASNKPERASYHVMLFLAEQGYTVYPVNPGIAGQEIGGLKVYATLDDVPKPVDMVDIFRNSADVPPVVDAAIGIGGQGRLDAARHPQR